MIDGTLVIMIYSIYLNYYFCTYKFAAIILNENRVDCTVQVGNEILPQVEVFGCLGVVRVKRTEEFDGGT